MQYATLLDEWLEEAVEKAVEKAEVQAHVRGMHDHAIASILRILTVRFALLEAQQIALKATLIKFTDLSKLDELEDRALRAFTLAEFTEYLENLLPQPYTNGSTQ